MYRKVIFSVVASILAFALLIAGSTAIAGTGFIYVVQAVYYTGAVVVFILALLPWVRLERD